MIEVLVWLLVSIPTDYRSGGVNVVERFKSQQQCEHVLKATEVHWSNKRMKCIQANIYIKD